MKELYEVRQRMSDEGLNDIVHIMSILINESESNDSVNTDRLMMIAEHCKARGHDKIALQCKKAVSVIKNRKIKSDDRKYGQELFENMSDRSVKKIHLKQYDKEDIDRYFK